MRRHRFRFLSAVAVAAVGVGSTVFVAQAAATGCGVTYSVPSQWNNGFTANVTVTNLGDPLSSWTLTWSFASGQRVTQAWNATATQSGAQVSARSVSHNANLATGATATFGFNGSWTGSNPAPTSFALNGVACTGAPVTTTTSSPTSTTSSSTTSPTSPTSTTSVPPTDNPAWGRSLPPADAPTSMAYDIVVSESGSGYTPKAGECSREVHARYWAYGPDGKVYPTWHPPRDASGCAFGHEHGDDPRTSDLFADAKWPYFGYTSEVMMAANPGGAHRHEDHVGHKVLAVNNSNVIQGDNGTSFFPPQGTTIATCDILLKFHQGTHSPDAFTNNVHELIYNNKCTHRDNNQVTEAKFTALIPNGRPGGFGATDCPGPFNNKFTNVGPAIPADSPSDTRSLGRLITDAACVQAIREGKTHFEVITGTEVPFDTNDLHEFWFSDVTISTSQLSFNIQPLFYVLNPARYYDASKPNKLARQVDLCYEGIRGDYCNTVRRITEQTGQRVAWDDPRSPFKGTLREFRAGGFKLRNSGPTAVYTDVYGRNASTTPFNGSIKQYFSGNHAEQNMFVRGATRDYAANSADQIHAPN